MENKDIVQKAGESGSFKALMNALRATGIGETLHGRGPFTLFAPNDEAFKKLSKEQVQELTRDKQKLAEVIRYHVVPGKVSAGEVAMLKRAKTVQGQDLEISTGAGVMVKNARVVRSDIEASNGIIHVIDEVLLPQ